MKVGDECLAQFGRSWVDATIDAVHDDGMVSVIEKGSQSFFDRWTGLTADEISIDDKSVWDALMADKGWSELASPEVRELFEDAQMPIDEESVRAHLVVAVNNLFGRTEADPTLTPDEAYAMMRRTGQCGKSLTEWERLVYGPFYWNQVRMGGRKPEGLTVLDWPELLPALGLADAQEDAKELAAIEALEAEHGFVLPADLRRFAATKGVGLAVYGAHPNAPDWRPVAEWNVVTDGRSTGFSANIAIEVIQPHQGDHSWWMCFRRGADEVTVDLQFPGDPPWANAAAPSLRFFLWDLWRTRVAWESLN